MRSDMHLKRLLILLLATAAVALLAVRCGGGRAAAVTVKGSDTMVILGQRWAEAYMAAHPGAMIQVTGGGSGTGMAALINGTTDLCQSSRPIKDGERRQIQEKYGQPPTETVVARDGLAVYLHDSNPVAELTLGQLKDIYTGKITRWEEVGAPPGRIILYSRENNSGTYMFFMEFVVKKKDFSPFARSLPGTAAVANAVGHDKRGIGYGGSAYAKGIKYCAVRAKDGAPAFFPTEENILSGQYPVSRELFFYTRGEPAAEVKKFIDWVRGPAGQKIVHDVGYFPVGA